MVTKRVENYVSPQGKAAARWECVCDCGNIVYIHGGSLRKGKTLSCGCYHLDITREKFIKKLEGQRFGRLVVLNLSSSNDGSKSNKVVWECQCDCGTIVFVRASDLSSGNTSSCGCYGRERNFESKFVDISGKVFGKLTVISFSHSDRRTYWNCSCSCGNELTVSLDDLNSGKVKSCGCLRESFIASELKNYFIKNHGAEKEHKVIKNPKTNQWLRCDIYIPHGKNPESNGFYIEINGEQHYKINDWHKRMAKSKGTTPEEEFEYQKYKDKIKKKFAKKNGIYIEIDLRKEESIEEIKEEILSIIKRKTVNNAK